MKHRLTEHSALGAALLGFVAAVIVALIARSSQLVSLAALLPMLFTALAVSLIVLLRARMDRLAEEEQRDQALLARERPASALFRGDDAESAPFSINRGRAQLERFLIPLVAPVLGLGLLYWVWRLHRNGAWEWAEARAVVMPGAVLAGLAFVTFLASRFLLGLSRQPEARLLRGPGVFLGLCCWSALLALGGLGAHHAGWIEADGWIGRVLLIATAMVGIELALNSVLALYRHQSGPRVTTYESRLGALLVDPGILTRSMTEAMDYQFGFTFSQTWLFKLIRQALLPLLVAQAALLYGMSCLVFLAPHETGILERFGRPVPEASALGSGFHFKKPWPFETIRRIPTGRVHNLEIGFERHAGAAAPALMTWTVPHYEHEDVFLVASRSIDERGGEMPGQSGVPVSMITVNIPIHYRITNAWAYTYHYAQPAEGLRHLGYQVVTRQLARRDLAELFSAERMAISAAMASELQALADRHRLGVEIVFVGLQGIHPPVQVAAAFQSVVGALEEKEAAILEARAYTNQVMPLARAYADTERVEAAAYRQRRIVLAEAESRDFTARLTAHQASPRVYRAYQYLDTLQEAAAPSRLYVLDLPDQGSQTLWLNLEEKPFSGALEMAPLLLEGGH